MTLVTGNLVLAEEVRAGWVRTSGSSITAVGVGACPRPEGGEEVIDGGTGFVLPGLIDLHVHGGGGDSFGTDAPAARQAVDFHARHGTTSTLASLVSAPRAELFASVRGLAELAQDGVIAGIHIEGPFLSPLRRGAHDPGSLRNPDRGEIDAWLDVGRGSVRMITLAPELPGALTAITHLRSRGVVVAIGHTDATSAQTQAAIEYGATHATHLFNGMRPLHHREGGPVATLLADERVTCELIVDGAHLSAEIVRLVHRVAGADRLVLATDAIAAAGEPDGDYQLGAQRVRVVNGVARTSDGSSLVGSTLTLDAAVRTAVSFGVPLVDAVRAASLTPARVLGLHGGRGALAAGYRADLVLTHADLRPARVMRQGAWL